MKRSIFLFAFLCITLTSFCQRKKIDSLYTVLKNHPQEDTIRVELLFTICKAEFLGDGIKKLPELANEALSISKKINFVRGIGNSYTYLAIYYKMIGNFDKVADNALKMAEVYERSSNFDGLANAYNMLALAHMEWKNYDKEKEYLEKALALNIKLGDRVNQAVNYANFGTMYTVTGDYKEAINYFLKTLKINQEFKDERAICGTYSNLAEVYVMIGDYTKGKKYFLSALSLAKKTGYKDALANIEVGLSVLYSKTKQYKEALDHGQQALVLALDIKNNTRIAEAYNTLCAIEENQNNFKSSLNYLRLYNQYKDSIFTENKMKQAVDLETRYETAKKDLTIQALEQQKQTQYIKQLYLVGAILLVTVAFLIIYVLQRVHNKKVNLLLETQKILNQKLQETDQLKSRFFANISHEFRTPLSLILAPMEEKLGSKNISSSERESATLVKRSANRLLSLVNQLLDLSKLEAGKMELHVQSGNLKKLLTVIAASFDSLAENKKIHFIKNINFDLEESWYDADKVEKIINNILFNAFKFTPSQGTVTFSVFSSDQALKIVIQDTGAGIAEEDQQHIFSPFYQSKNVADDGSGTGLGLSLVKELVKLYGGSIELTSAIDQGTTIAVVLPVAKEKFPASAVSASEAHHSENVKPNHNFDVLAEKPSFENIEGETEISHLDTILIVEDNEDLRKYIASTLGDQFTILAGKDGEEGFNLAIEHIPNLIISDVMMPKLTGIDLTEKIKTDERTSHIPVVLLTAKADRESRLEGLKTGADDYLAKPFSTEELQIRVKNLIEQRKKLAAKYKERLSLTPTPLTAEASLDEKFIHRAKEIVEKNISDSGFGVEQLADEIHLSRTQLFRKLKAIAGLSPNEFINDIRLLKAAELIRAKADTLAQISYAVGFNEQSYFTKRFRKKFGVTPTEYNSKPGHSPR